MNKITLYSLGIASSIIFTACAGGYEVSPNLATLNIKFDETKWDGKKVPSDGVCINKGGKGYSPALKISNLPINTNTIVMSFSDNTYLPMANGGHGVISYKIEEGKTSILVPSFVGETFKLPTNFVSINEHKASARGKTPGAYLGPCSGGRGNNYSVNIKAIHDYNSDSKKSLLLGQTNLKLGRY